MHATRRIFLQLAAAATSRLVRADVAAYHEIYRPHFHFTPNTGWTNDSNGLLWYKGEYHLFFQHNLFETRWGNMTWGHAISQDLVHWTQMENALLPDQMGTMFSGSGKIRGRKVSYSVQAKEKRLSNGDAGVAVTPAAKGRLKLRILVDRTSVEVFANDGEWVMPCCFVPKPEDPEHCAVRRRRPRPRAEPAHPSREVNLGIAYESP